MTRPARFTPWHGGSLSIGLWVLLQAGCVSNPARMEAAPGGPGLAADPSPVTPQRWETEFPGVCLDDIERTTDAASAELWGALVKSPTVQNIRDTYAPSLVLAPRNLTNSSRVKTPALMRFVKKTLRKLDRSAQESDFPITVRYNQFATGGTYRDPGVLALDLELTGHERPSEAAASPPVVDYNAVFEVMCESAGQVVAASDKRLPPRPDPTLSP